MQYKMNHHLLPQVEPLILDRPELEEPLAKFNAAKAALTALPARYAAAHEQWKAQAQKAALGAPLPLEPDSYPPVSARETAERQIRFAADALTAVVAGSRDEFMDVVKAEQTELFEEVKDMIARLDQIKEELHGLARSAQWIDAQSPAHPHGRERHLLLDMDAPALIKAVANGSTFIDNTTGRV